MKIESAYSHLNGLEWLLVHEKAIWREVQQIIRSVDASRYKTKVSREKSMRGRNLYAPRELNRRFAEEFRKCGWQESRTSYWVTDDYKLIRKTLSMPPDQQRREIQAAGRRAIFSYNQTDFVKNRVAIEVQFGKYNPIASR